MGRANAAVLPLPVSARPIKSRPARARGIDSAWIGVGALYPNFSQASQSESVIPYNLLDYTYILLGAGSSLPDL